MALEEFRKQYQARLDVALLDRSKAPGHAIFKAFLDGGKTLPRRMGGKGDPGTKLASALKRRKPAQYLIGQIPVDLSRQHAEEVEEFRKQYQARLDVPLRDDSKAPGHATFEAYLAGGTLPKQGEGKGDPGKKLSKALTRRIPAQDLINQIPKDLRESKPEAVEAFRLEYEVRLRRLPEKDP